MNVEPSPGGPLTEREEFAQTFLALGEHAPTILPGWDAADLLEHLLLREGAPQLIVGQRLPGPLGAAARQRIEDLRALPWPARVEKFRAGPGRFSIAGRVDGLTGQAELLIHHEDLRRAQDGHDVRALDRERTAAAWRAVGYMAPVVMRVPADVTLISALGGRRFRARSSRGSLRVHGDPLELLLWVSGRDEIARVRLHGDEGARRALAEGRRGL